MRLDGKNTNASENKVAGISKDDEEREENSLEEEKERLEKYCLH